MIVTVLKSDGILRHVYGSVYSGRLVSGAAVAFDVVWRK